MNFNTPNGPVWEPENLMLRSFYEALRKHAPTLAGSPAFEDFKEVYEALEFDMREENGNEFVRTINSLSTDSNNDRRRARGA